MHDKFIKPDEAFRTVEDFIVREMTENNYNPITKYEVAEALAVLRELVKNQEEN